MPYGKPGARERALAWLLTPFVLLALDATVTRTPILWAPTSFEESDLSRLNFSQTFQAARKIYWPESEPDRAVLVLGNSRARLGLRKAPLEEALASLHPGPRVRIDNLAVFGAGPAALEVLSRHLVEVDAALAILAIAPSDLGIPLHYESNHPIPKLLARGWADDGLEEQGASRRIDRWLRSIWRLARFREFARAAIRDRLDPMVDNPPRPERFTSTAELFAATRPGVGPAVETKYREFVADPGLPSFLAYLRVGQAPHIDDVRHRIREARVSGDLERQAQNLRRLVARASTTTRTLVLLLPENPVMAEDEDQVFHDEELDLANLARIHSIAAASGVEVLDARHWMGIDAFIDLDHLLPDLSGFERRVAPEILRAL